MISPSDFLMWSGTVMWVWIVWQCVKTVHDRWRRLLWAIGPKRPAVRRAHFR